MPKTTTASAVTNVESRRIARCVVTQCRNTALNPPKTPLKCSAANNADTQQQLWGRRRAQRRTFEGCFHALNFTHCKKAL